MQWIDNEDFVDKAIAEGVNHLVFSANSVVRASGLVMGKGAAKRVRDYYPGIDKEFGKILDRLPAKDYYVLTIMREECAPSIIHALQVKRHYRDDGDIELCRLSLRKLSELLGGEPAVMNCPLIGAGGFAQRAQEVFDMVEEELSNTSVFVTRTTL